MLPSVVYCTEHQIICHVFCVALYKNLIIIIIIYLFMFDYKVHNRDVTLCLQIKVDHIKENRIRLVYYSEHGECEQESWNPWSPL